MNTHMVINGVSVQGQATLTNVINPANLGFSFGLEGLLLFTHKQAVHITR